MGQNTMLKQRILCFVESDVTIRHFLLSGSLRQLFECHDVTLVFPPDNYSRIRCDLDALGFSSISMERVAIPNQRLRQWKQAYHHDQMRLRFGYGWWQLWRAWWSVLGWKAAIMFFFANLPIVTVFVTRHYSKQLDRFPAHELDSLLDRHKPDILLHPSTFDGYFVNDFVEQGAKRKIPTILLMNSWDNPSIKRATSGMPDWVAVWGEQTRRHTNHFMGVPLDRIVILGAAQFEVYRAEPRLTREQFRREHGMSDDSRILLYAGSSKGSLESLHLQWLNDAVAAGVLPEFSILYRPHPWGVSQQEAQVILKGQWPHVVVESSMRPLLERICAGTNDGGFFMAEYARTHDILSCVDAVISPLSTIILESALHGLPVMCFFPHEEDKNSNWVGLRKLVHFEDMFKSPAVLVADSYPEFMPKVRELIRRTEDAEFKSRIMKETQFFCEFHPKGYGAALLDLIDLAIAPGPSGPTLSPTDDYHKQKNSCKSARKGCSYVES